jgi:broad specificity phosphatase PhoE
VAVFVTRLWLVRHGRAAAGWNVDPDPDLDKVGHEQAARVADRLAIEAGRVDILTSPLVRCRSTASAIATRIGVEPMVCQQVAEIPSPAGIAMADRMEWLRAAMMGTWSELGTQYVNYRDGVVRFLQQCTTDVIVVTHFVAINAVIGAITGNDHLMVSRLDNCSVTILERNDDGSLVLIAGGDEADTVIR